MDISEYDYELPEHFIAQEPMNPREKAKLMIVHKHQQHVEHKHIADFPDCLRASDVLVLNNTKVFNARLKVTIRRPNLPDRSGELFLVKPSQSETTSSLSTWICIGKPGKAFSIGAVVVIQPDIQGKVIETSQEGTFTVEFRLSNEEVIEIANKYGSVPIPPYIKKIPNSNEYQTIYASNTGSVAAPTAGLHITPSLLQTIKDKGIEVIEITLHVGLGTFMPIKTTTIESHVMHSEWVNITQQAADSINKAKAEGRRIIAVGTTSTRALEGVAALQGRTLAGSDPAIRPLKGFTGDVNLFITPGFTFRVIDGLLTNFHLPKSTLLLLVSGLAGKETIRYAYKEAIDHQYRFYSFGDAMFISPED